MKFVTWTKKDVNKIKLNQYLKKFMLKWAVRDDVYLTLTYGAVYTLKARKHELLPDTLRLIVMSGAIPLVKLILDCLDDKLLQKVADNKKYWNILNNLDDTTLKSLLPILCKNPEELNDRSFYVLQLRIFKLFPEFQETALKYDALRYALLRSDAVRPEILLKIIERDPNEFGGFSDFEALVKYIKEGKLKLVLGEDKHEKPNESVQTTEAANDTCLRTNSTHDPSSGC